MNANSLSELPAGVFSGLSSLVRLYLDAHSRGRVNDNSLNELPEDVFSGLSSLERLQLGGNGFTALPEGVFSGLSNLNYLHLGRGSLDELPAGVFSGLSSLTQLWLNTNSLNELPAGVFSGLSSLTNLDLLQNDRILPLIVSLEKVGAAGVRAVAPAGAPFALTLPVVVANGALAGGATTLAIAAGEVATEAVTVVPGNTGAVTVDLGTPLPRLPSGHQGYAITRAATGLPVTTQAATTCTLNQGDLWCGVVTVDPVAVTGLTNGHGYSDAGSAGDLTVPRGFTAGPDTYTINTVATGAFDGAQGLLFSLDSGLTAAVSSSLELHVRGDQFAFSDSADVPQAGVYFWPTSQDWSSEPSVTLTLRGLASMDATLSDLAVSDGGSDLLTFASGTTTYTAMVANDVATVTFTATKNDAGASVEYLDADGNVLADADTTEDGFQVVLEVALAVGANAITVRVTAENGTPVQDYTVTVTRAEGPPTVTVAAAAGGETVPEGTDAAFTLSRTGATAAALTVTVAVSQTGSVLQDASAVPSSVTFAAGAATATLALATNDDDTDDDDGTVTVTLGADTGYQVGTPGAATVAVSDNDVPVDFVLAVPATVAEDAGTATVTVTATTAENAPPATLVEVQLARVGGTATGGDDYEAVSETVPFQVSDFAAATVDGQPRYRAVWTHDVTIHDDEEVEDDETLVLEMSPSLGVSVDLHAAGRHRCGAGDADDRGQRPAGGDDRGGRGRRRRGFRCRRLHAEPDRADGGVVDGDGGGDAGGGP